MKEISVKTTGSTYTASEFEDRDTELEGSVTRSGQTLNQAVPIQLGRAMNINGIAAQTYQDSGTANAIELTPITGSSGLVVPENYTQFSGGIVEFFKSAANTSTTVTVNIGQTTGAGLLGAKPLKDLNGSDPVAGGVTGWLRIRWDNASDYWVILGSTSSTFLSQQITSNYDVPTPDTVNRALSIDATAGDVTITFQTVVLGDVYKKIIVYNAVNVANDVIISGLFDEDYILSFGEVIIASTQQVTTGVYSWVVEKRDSQTQKILEQNDFNTSIEQPASTTLFEFSGNNLANSSDVLPKNILNITSLPSDDSNAKFSNRRFIHLDDGFMLYSYTFGNEGYIAFRIKPNWAYDISSAVSVLDLRGGGSATDDRIMLNYEVGPDKFFLYVDDDSGNNIRVNSDAFLSNPALQVWIDFVITWSKSGNDADLYIDGVQQTGVNKTVNGSGITNLNITSTELSVGSANYTGAILTTVMNAYITDMLVKNAFDSSDTNYDGSVNVKSNFNYNRVAYLNHNALIDNNGNAGFKNTFSENGYINNDLFLNGYKYNGDIFLKEKLIEIGPWDMNTDQSVAIAHGIDSGSFRIVSISVVILSDGNITGIGGSSSRFPLPNAVAFGSAANSSSTGAYTWNSTYVSLSRVSPGFFASVNFDSVSINRGYILIKYAKNNIIDT